MMTRRILTVLGLSLAFACLFHPQAQAVVLWDFCIADAQNNCTSNLGFVEQGQSVDIFGKIVNRPESTNNFYGSDILTFVYPPFPPNSVVLFDFAHLNPAGHTSSPYISLDYVDLDPLVIEPGQESRFYFGTLTPTYPGYTQPGRYTATAEVSLYRGNFGTSDYGSPFFVKTDTGTHKEFQEIGLNVIPEPSSLILISTGLLGLVGWRRRFRA